MIDFDYSNDALNVKSAFYGVDKMLYVEGEDDVVFWELLLEKFNITGYEVQSLGGVKEVKKYIDKIKSNEIDSVVARDSDFTELDSKYKKIPNVIRTYGHSIENTLVTEQCILDAILFAGKLSKSDLDEAGCKAWIATLENEFKEAVIFDAANDISKAGVPVLGLNCTRFMKSEKSCVPDSVKIQGLVQGLKTHADLSKSKGKIERILNKSQESTLKYMRGHFLQSAAIKYINSFLRNKKQGKSISNDSLFITAIMTLKTNIDKSHPHYAHYKSELSSL